MLSPSCSSTVYFKTKGVLDGPVEEDARKRGLQARHRRYKRRAAGGQHQLIVLDLSGSVGTLVDDPPLVALDAPRRGGPNWGLVSLPVPDAGDMEPAKGVQQGSLLLAFDDPRPGPGENQLDVLLLQPLGTGQSQLRHRSVLEVAGHGHPVVRSSGLFALANSFCPMDFPHTGGFPSHQQGAD